MKRELETYIVDSFTNEAFKGNPAGVCILDIIISDKKMSLIAKELGLSETTFIKKLDAPNKYSIRYFSPKTEIPLCGHATLAASKVLFERDPTLDKIHFINIQELDLFIEKEEDSIKMFFPIYNTLPEIAPQSLLNALGIENTVNVSYNKETNILILEIEDCEILRSLSPNFEKLVKSHNSINGVLVTSRSNQKDFDFESRYFWPWSGTNEDPVTGATHTFLTKYWSKRLGVTKMRSFQCSERTGFMDVELIDDHHFSIKSMAKIIFEGKLRV